MQPVLSIDTHSVFFRAFFALPPLTTRAGQHTSAVYGLSALLLKLLREQEPAALGFARDAPARTFRHAAYPDYKAQRVALATPLRQQFPLLERLLEALEVPVFAVEGFEADDVLATLARELRAQAKRVRIVSGDRDLFQLVGPDLDVLFIGARGRTPVVYDEAKIAARFGVAPSQLPSLMALVGDASDNLEGVAGVGLRTGQRLIARFGDIRGLLEHRDELEKRALRETVAAHAQQLIRNETLARLRVDVPLPEGPRCAPVTAQAAQRVRALFVELEFHSLLGRLDKWAARYT